MVDSETERGRERERARGEMKSDRERTGERQG